MAGNGNGRNGRRFGAKNQAAEADRQPAGGAGLFCLLSRKAPFRTELLHAKVAVINDEQVSVRVDGQGTKTERMGRKFSEKPLRFLMTLRFLFSNF